MARSQALSLGHSPDPDDAFMFYALAEHKIDTRGWNFEHTLQDIQTLNERATRSELAISAISIHAYAFVSDRYALLPCGASMGDGYGPMLVVKRGVEFPTEAQALKDWLRERLIAVPGLMTSAWLSLQLYLADPSHHAPPAHIVVPFDEIFPTVLEGKAEVGLIIHEGQLTYRQEGFEKVLDLGQWWKAETGLPLPLGGNVIRKDFSLAERSEINIVLRESIEYGLQHRKAGVAHAMPLARGIDETLADEFIGMYVNDYTLDYGDTGRAAIREFLGRAHATGLIPEIVNLEFVV